MAQSTTTLAYALVSVLALGLGGCYDSRAPLGPASEGFLDPALLGPWQCASAEAPDQPGDTLQLQLFRFDETQYYVSWQQGSDPPEHLRAYSSSVEDQPFLNVQWLETGPGGESGYTFVGYSFPAEGELELRTLRSGIFDADDRSPEAARATLEYVLHDSEAFSEPVSCRRPGARRPFTP